MDIFQEENIDCNFLVRAYPSWIPTEKLKTRTNVSAFKPSWTYVWEYEWICLFCMADIWESVPNSVKPNPCHDKKRIYNGKCEDQSTGFIFLVPFLLIMIMNVNPVKIYVLLMRNTSTSNPFLCTADFSLIKKAC